MLISILLYYKQKEIDIMGYRLEISKIEYALSCGKLFGYGDKLKEYKSYQWLLKREKISGEDEEYWGYGFNPQIILNKREFKEFIDLYYEDRGWDYDDEMKLLVEKNCDKLLEWY